jgi:hypothetical protein
VREWKISLSQKIDQLSMDCSMGHKTDIHVKIKKPAPLAVRREIGKKNSMDGLFTRP